MSWLRWLSCALFYGNYSEASITGITYMDNFDAVERYRDVNECNPFHWHPLHLPEECLQTFETLIRYGLHSLTPYRIVKEKQQHNYEPLSPFELLFKLLRRDISSLPTAPTLAVSPLLGTLALYRQPVSYKTVDMIKRLSKAYANAVY